jgi:uncharacterized protein
MKPEPPEPSGRPPSVWVFRCHREGDNAQSLALAQALGWPFEVKELQFHWWEIFPTLADRLTLAGVDRRRSSPLVPPWPDLIILAGRRNELPARWIREQSGGRAKVVVIGRWWTPPEKLDLAITTPQFRLPTHANALHNRLPLHLVNEERLAEARAHWEPRLSHLPHPRFAVLVGGSSGPYVFSRETAQRLGREASAMARAMGGSLMVSTSARTRPRAIDALAAALDVPHELYRWRPSDPQNPYFGYAALADEFIVTGDSISMLAEACATERPVHVFEFGGGPAAMRGPRSKTLPVHAWWRWPQLRDQGVVGLHYAFAIGLPATRLNRSRDIRLAQEALIESGHARWMGDSEPPPLDPMPFDEMERAVARVRALFGLPAYLSGVRHSEEIIRGRVKA